MATSEQILPPRIAVERLTDDEILLTRAEAAPVIRSSVPTMERWAKIGSGPRITRINHRVFYRLSDLREFIANGGIS